MKGYISEVFGSFQGEGPYIGERHVFVRFAGCGLGCDYCDTPGRGRVGQKARIEEGPGGPDALVANPLALETVLSAVYAQEPVPGFNAALSITGGEPLEQTEFLLALLGALGGRFRVLLETNGVHAGRLSGVIGMVDVVSMDMKLPSVSGLGPLWEKHSAFIDACTGAELVVKAVVSADTPPGELAYAARLVAERSPGAQFVIQPLTAKGGRSSVPAGRLLEFYREARDVLRSVRVIPQAHKILGVR